MVLCKLSMVVLLASSLGACGGSLGESAGDSDAGPRSQDGSPVGDVDATSAADADGDGIADDVDNCPMLANPLQADGDGDGYGNDCDCEPGDATIAADLVLSDSLATDNALLNPATGFPLASWTYGNGGYQQTRLDDEAADAAFFNLPEPLTDVRVSLTAASTDVESFDGDDLRQLFVALRASSSAAAFESLGCGIEFVEDLAQERRTSAIILGGSPAAPTTTVGAREDYDGVDQGDLIAITADLRGDTLTCSVTVDGETTVATVSGQAVKSGSVGFYTRETAALFQNVSICSYRSP